MAAKSTRGEYNVHPGVAMMVRWVTDLKSKTGRSLDEWVAHIRKAGPKDEAARRDWLKKEHNLGTNTAWWLAERADPEKAKSVDDDPDAYLAIAPQYVDGQYPAGKAALRPIYEALLILCRSLGKDVKVCPCKTMVPLYRNHVFAQIKATTRTRIDLGLSLTHYKGKLPARVIDTGGRAKKDRITHRIEISREKDIDADVKKWLKIAYDLDGE